MEVFTRGYRATPAPFGVGCIEVVGEGAAGGSMKSSVIKRSIIIGGRKTSVSLEDPFWDGLKNIAHAQRVTLSELVAQIDDARKQSNLSSAIRLFVLEHFQNENKRVDETDTRRASASAEDTQAT